MGCGSEKANRKEIKLIQEELNNRGFSAGRPDGKVGNKTINALKKFQKNNGWFASGKIDNRTAKKLGISLAAYDETRYLSMSGTLVDAVYLEPNSSELVDFSNLGNRLPDGDCFTYRVFGTYYE